MIVVQNTSAICFYDNELSFEVQTNQTKSILPIEIDKFTTILLHFIYCIYRTVFWKKNYKNVIRDYA